MRRLALALSLVLAAAAASPAVAGGWEPRDHHRYRAPSEAMIVTERHERTEIHVRFDEPEPDPRDVCMPYIHAIWVHHIPVVNERLACVWPDGTIRNGPRPY